MNEINSADEFARENLVQARKGVNGVYHAKIESRHISGSAKGGLLEEELEDHSGGTGCCKQKNSWEVKNNENI